MRFFKHFIRNKGGSGTALGSETAPTYSATPKAPSLGADNVMSAKVNGIGLAIRRVAVAYWFSGGNGPDIPVDLWVYDHESEQWYKASSGTLSDGTITYLQAPYMADPPQTNANMTRPTSGGVDYMLLAKDPGAGAGNGDYHFSIGPDIASS